jgi:hypothetical protein
MQARRLLLESTRHLMLNTMVCFSGKISLVSTSPIEIVKSRGALTTLRLFFVEGFYSIASVLVLPELCLVFVLIKLGFFVSQTTFEDIDCTDSQREDEAGKRNTLVDGVRNFLKLLASADYDRHCVKRWVGLRLELRLECKREGDVKPVDGESCTRGAF